MTDVDDTMLFIDPAVDMKPPPFAHDPLKALVVPRPIGWISSISAAGVVNLAPFSYFNLVSGDPPCVIYCPNGDHPDGGAKDSLLNVRETGEFVCNLADVLFGAVLIFRHDYRQASLCASMISPRFPTSSKRKPIFSASSQVTSMGWPRFKAS